MLRPWIPLSTLVLLTACGGDGPTNPEISAVDPSQGSLCMQGQCGLGSGYLSSPKLVRIRTGQSSKCAGAIVANPCAVLTAAHCDVRTSDRVHRAGSPTTRAIADTEDHPKGPDIAVHCLNGTFANSFYDIGASFPPGQVDAQMYGQDDALYWGSQMQFRHVDVSASAFFGEYDSYPDCANDDSGGPIVIANGGVEEVIGVHSGSQPGCGSGGMYGARTDIYRNWILSRAAQCWDPSTQTCTFAPTDPELPGPGGDPGDMK